MPLDTIYLTRHGVSPPTHHIPPPTTSPSPLHHNEVLRIYLQHRLNWTIDYKTGTYHAQFPTPTGNPADPTLTSHGVLQSHELAAHFTSDNVSPKPFRIYSSPFYRCLQTIQPTVEALKQQQQQVSTTPSTNNEPPAIDTHADLTVRTEPGLGYVSPSSPSLQSTNITYKLISNGMNTENGSAQQPSSTTQPPHPPQSSLPTSPPSSHPHPVNKPPTPPSSTPPPAAKPSPNSTTASQPPSRPSSSP